MASADRSEPTKAAPRDWQIAAAGFVGQTASAMGFLSFPLFAPALAQATGLNERDFSFATTFVFFAATLASPYAGRLTRDLGSVKAMAVLFVGMAAGMLLTAGGMWATAMLAGFVFGIFYGAFQPVSSMVVATRTSPRRRAMWLAVRQSGVPFAGALAGRILPPTILAFGLFAGVLTVSAAMVLGAIAVCLLPSLYRAPTGETAARTAVAPTGSAISRFIGRYKLPGLMQWVALSAVGFAIIHLALASFGYFYLIEELGFSEVAAGIFLSNVLLAAALGRPVMGWLVDRTGSPVFVLGVVALLAAVAFVMMLNIDVNSPPALLLATAIMGGISSNTWTPVFLAAAAQASPAGQVTEFTGRAFAYAAIGWMLAAPVMWTAIELSDGYRIPFHALIAVTLTMSALFFVMSRRPLRPATEEASG